MAYLQGEFEMNKQLRDLQTRCVCAEGGELYRQSKLSWLSLVPGLKMIKFVSSGQLLLDSVAQRNIVFFCISVSSCCLFCYENPNSKKKGKTNPD